MKIHIVYDQTVKWQADYFKDNTSSFGYDIVEHEIPPHPEGLPFGQTIGDITYYPKSQWKPFFIREQLSGGDVMYMDVDIQLKEKVDELFEHDVVVTVHDRERVEDVYFRHITATVNAGMIFIKNNKNGREFVDRWCDVIKRTISGSDQEALSIMCQYGFPDYVKTVPTTVYNNLTPDKRDEETRKAKALHYVGWRKKIHPAYHEFNEKRKRGIRT